MVQIVTFTETSSNLNNTFDNRLREAGAVVLAKTNLSEWANFRSEKSSSGWSAVGGLTRNPVATDPSGDPVTALGSRYRAAKDSRGVQ